MQRPIAQMRNLGPVTAEMLAEIGIETSQALEETGAVEAFQALRHRFGNRVSMTALHAMHASLQDRDWRSLTPAEKDALRRALG